MKTKPEIEIPESTEEKIKEAARRVFTRKGFAGTRTRDIAEESGFNLALINYYFRSKEKLFDIIVLEHMQTFLVSVREILNDQGTTLEEKILALQQRKSGLVEGLLNEDRKDALALTPEDLQSLFSPIG